MLYGILKMNININFGYVKLKQQVLIIEKTKMIKLDYMINYEFKEMV